MPRKLALTLAVKDYDRTNALLSGRVAIEGCDVVALAVEAAEMFHRAFKFREFDISELSLSSHMATVVRGENEYVGIPAFPLRVFRHSGIYIRTDRGIREPKDLRGKIVGVPEYQQTATVWIRGILQDEYGVKPEEMKWRRGGVDEPGRKERTPIELPARIELKQIPDDRTLSDMLEKGEIDAILNATPPLCFQRGAAHVDRLFPDFRAAEQDYYRRTGLFPIMHLVGVRRSLAEQHPWLPVNIYKAFLAAKEIATRELGEPWLMATLPWIVDHYNETRRVMGEDYWPYGFQENLKQLETFSRYHHEQGISPRLMRPEELFAPSTLDLAKH